MDTSSPVSTPPVGQTAEDKAVAILSYLTLIGFIIAIVMHSSKKTKLGAFHLRQVLGYMVAGFAGGIAVGILMFIMMLVGSFIHFLLLLLPLIWIAFALAMIALWFMGLLAAINGEMKPIPVIGAHIQKYLGTTFE